MATTQQSASMPKPEPEGTGGVDQPRDESREGRQEPELLGAGRRRRSGRKVVGFGTGKAKEVPAAIKKGIEAAKKNLRKVHVLATTIQHPVLGEFGSGQVLLKPAPEGTGVIAGGPVRAVITAVGIPNVLTKSIGSHNPHNVVKATIDALEQLRDKSGNRRSARASTSGRWDNQMPGKIKIKLIRSPICTPEKHKVIVGRWVSGRSIASWSAPTRRRFAAWSRRFRTCWRSWNRRSE